jgi:hypothetical protein
MTGNGIERYRGFLGARYRTFLQVFEEFRRIGGRTIVELGTTRSFVSGGHDGCVNPDPRFWQPDRPEVWDWGAGMFTRMCAEHLHDMNPEIHTVDISIEALAICRVITADYAHLVRYHHARSVDFLRAFPQPVDLLYMDAGETDSGAERLHLREARVVTARQMFSPQAQILVDDVNVPGTTESKGRLSIPYFCRNGFTVRFSGYQVVLQR